ncbi:Inner membrane protein yhaI [Kingella potus]|uniref:Inner membrane protein yhaI n=1 Tax=Kingella potus TaxID=265175 RepID=A0A377R3J5_9NEIS|nr:DUF805 domain-containing protein [Kingella potus]UOP00727.1 DUF805 domain-containing protein [Kingella potus]STR02873.1 Inner membrane protein yhaI [Kingella potus]
MKWYFAVLKNYVGFSGRASRREYWMFMLCHFIVAFMLGFIAGLMRSSTGGSFNFIGNLYLLATFLPSLAVQVRRLHDTDRSGWYSLIALLPGIGFIIVLILCALEGTAGNNNYGAEPRSEI